MLISLAVSPDGETICSAGDHDNTCYAWDVASGEIKARLKVGAGWGGGCPIWTLERCPMPPEGVRWGGGQYYLPGCVPIDRDQRPPPTKDDRCPQPRLPPARTQDDSTVGGTTVVEALPDSASLAVANFEGGVCVWDLTSRVCKIKFEVCLEGLRGGPVGI